MILALIVAFFCYLIAQLILSHGKNKPRLKPTGNLLIFDTETSGFPKNWKAALDDIDNWPRIVSISWNKIEPSGLLLSNKNFFIKPNDYFISNESVAIHGITNEVAHQKGFLLSDVLEEFNKELTDCSYLIAHNIEFDYAVTFCEYLRLKINTNKLSSIKQICTMKMSTDFCKIRSSKGYKYPKLSELYQKLFTVPISNAHNAQADADACMKCFKELYNQNVIKF